MMNQTGHGMNEMMWNYSVFGPVFGPIISVLVIVVLSIAIYRLIKLDRRNLALDTTHTSR